MDTFAAIALSTEPPMEKVLKSPPTSRSSILTAPIWRQVFGVSLWNFAITILLYIFGGYIGGLESFSYYGDKLGTSDPSNCYDDIAKIADIKANDKARATICQSYWGA